MANAWRPVVVETYGGWRYRWSAGVTRRASSVLAMGAAASVASLVDRAETFYAARGGPTMIQVSAASAPRGLVAELRERGYQPTARTLVRTAGTAAVLDRTGPTVPVEVTEAPTDEWFDAYWSVESTRRGAGDDAAVFRRFLLDPGLPTAFVAARDGHDVIGVGQVVFERGWAGVQCMATPDAHRRRGIASAVLNALAAQARRRNVAQMYLAVMAANAGAKALYERAGFRPAHEYSYFVDRDAGSPPPVRGG